MQTVPGRPIIGYSALLSDFHPIQNFNLDHVGARNFNEVVFGRSVFRSTNLLL